MLIVFCMLFVLRIGYCTDDQIFMTKTAHVGESVTLTCMRQKSWNPGNLFWIRLVAGNLPEVLGATFTFDYPGVNETPRITAKQKPGQFVLHITETELSDTAVYYCMKVQQLSLTFLNGAFLRIKGPEPNITAVIQDFPSEPVHPGDSVTLQCSVLTDSQTKSCPGEHSVYWFRAGSDESHPNIIYTHRNSHDGCEKSPETPSAPHSCVYSFSKNVSSSDAGTYYCAVATCGEILFGNGTKLQIEEKTQHTILLLLCAALAVCVIVIAFLIYTIKKKTCNCCQGDSLYGER
ncbi:signal-regulatory protein beta-2-like [Centroberyx affinis]|uniref:signal-regulatory protein beta-2-like n=1 Tax=Centroberyx affinis TaxID=166261 RepID=UPI003A5B9993